MVRVPQCSVLPGSRRDLDALCQDRDQEPHQAEAAGCNAAAEPPGLPGRAAPAKIIGEQVGVILLQDLLQPGPGHPVGLRDPGRIGEDGHRLPGPLLNGIFLLSRMGCMDSEQPLRPVNELNGVPVGIRAFGERACSLDIESEPGSADLVGVQEIEHVTDRSRGALRQVVEPGDLLRGYFSAGKVLGYHVGADKPGVIVSF